MAREAGVDASKLSTFLGSKERTEESTSLPGLNAENALRLWDYAHSRLQIQNDASGNSLSGKAAQPAQAWTTAQLGLSGTWSANAREENKLSLPADLSLIVKWFDSSRKGLACLGLVTASGGRMLMPRSGGVGRKIDRFANAFRSTPPTTEERFANTDQVRLGRYLDTAWLAELTFNDSNQYELVVIRPQGAIKAGNEFVIWAIEPDGLEIFGPKRAESDLDAELVTVARQLSVLLDSFVSE